MASWRSQSTISQSEELFAFLYCQVLKEIHGDELETGDCTDECGEACDEEKELYYHIVNSCASAMKSAYFFAIINTCTTYQHFLYHFNKNEDVERIITTKRSIRICCLGGGLHEEDVAICKIINDYFTPHPNLLCTESASGKTSYKVSIRVTTVDVCPQWEDEKDAVMNAAKECLLDSERVAIETRYIQADLLKSITTHLEEEITAADIVTMVRLGSGIMTGGSGNISALCRNLCTIVKLLKPDSCLFIQETEGSPLFRHLKDSLCSTTLSNVETYDDGVILTPKTLEIINAYSAIDLGQNTPERKSKASSCIWVQK